MISKQKNRYVIVYVLRGRLEFGVYVNIFNGTQNNVLMCNPYDEDTENQVNVNV